MAKNRRKIKKKKRKGRVQVQQPEASFVARGRPRDVAPNRDDPATWGQAAPVVLDQWVWVGRYCAGPVTPFGARIYTYPMLMLNYAGGWARPSSHDPLRRMFKNGALDVDDMRAAARIVAAVWQIAPNRVKTMATTRARDGSAQYAVIRAGGGRPGLLDGPEGGMDAVRDYLDWTDRMGAARLPIGPVLDVVIEGTALAAIDKRRGWRKGSAAKLIKTALGLWRPAVGGVRERKQSEKTVDVGGE